MGLTRTSKSYTYTIQWPSPSDFASMFSGSGLTYDQIKSQISSDIGSAFDAWDTPSGVTVSESSTGGDFTIDFSNLGGAIGHYNPSIMEVVFDTSQPFSFSDPCTGHYFFLTVALHEIGNAFTGSDAHDTTSSSAMHTTNPGRIVRGLGSCDSQAMVSLYYYQISYNNLFETNSTGGQMTVDGTTITLPATGQSHDWDQKSGWSHSLSAVDQQVGNYLRLFDNWNNDPNLARGFNLPTSSDGNYIANFKKQYNITFSGGSVTINYQTYQSNETYHAREGLTFQTTANPKIENSMYEVLSYWKKGNDIVGYDNPHSFLPNDHANYTIVYTALKPTNDYRNQHFNDTVGACVKVKWDKHPLDNSQIKKYSIFRKVRHNGVTGNEVQIGTVTANGSSNYSFVDYDYIITSGYTDLLFYDVRAFYDPDNDGTGVYSDADFISIFGELFSINQNNNQLVSALNSEKPENYSLSNYPNPFNPATTISYQLPKDGFVTIKVFDMLGKEIATLINENKSAGYYNIDFDARKLTSGVYIYTISANGFIQSKKMLLMK
ncbi:MAG: T9SS type A sorting domain-containing protein [Bacteroidetes bacterium]|nr:T9SS type A sorting domain-containing protein [Bacteroidota bacterium]